MKSGNNYNPNNLCTKKAGQTNALRNPMNPAPNVAAC